MDLLKSLIFMLNEMSPYVLLGFFIAGLMHAFVSQQTMSRHLSGNGWQSVLKAALIGVPLPLCSCGVLPTAIAMHRSGASKASSTSFLIATPQTGVDSIAATWSMLGPAFALLRPLAAFITAFFGGIAVGKSDKSNSEDLCASTCFDNKHRGFLQRLIEALRYGFVDLIDSIGSWLVVGLLVAALITVYVPDDFFSILGDNPMLSMIVALIIAIPMYVCATGSIPIAMSLVLKGLSPGTAFVLLMAGPAVNFASYTLISREMGRKVAAIMLCAIIIGAFVFGLAIDYLLPKSWFEIVSISGRCIHSFAPSDLFPMLCSATLVIMLIFSFYRKHKHGHNHTHITNTKSMTKTYNVKGMNCQHCRASVLKCILEVKGVTKVDVNLTTGIATVEGEHSAEELIEAVHLAGFEASIRIV